MREGERAHGRTGERASGRAGEWSAAERAGRRAAEPPEPPSVRAGGRVPAVLTAGTELLC